MRFLTFIWILFTPILLYSQARRAESLIERDKTNDAIELLLRTMEKDSLAPAEKFVLSKILFTAQGNYYNLDSAYHTLLKAISAYDLSEAKEQDKLISNGYTLVQFDSLKLAIETAGLRRSQELGREEDYLRFIDKFPTSTLIDSAVVLRNAAAYLIASNEDNYESYLSFMEKYSEAEEYHEAETRYEYLYFKAKTKSGKLADLESFLDNHPTTWHRNEVELAIYKIITGRNSAAAYEEFHQRYPKSYLKEKTLLHWYSSLDDGRGVVLKLLSIDQQDSLENITQRQKDLRLLTITDEAFQVIDQFGEVQIDSISNVSDFNKCSEDYQYLITTNGKVNNLLDLNGEVICTGEFDAYARETNGILKLSSADKYYFIHENGEPTNDKTYHEAFMPGPYIASSNSGKWGMESISGISLLPHNFDSIIAFYNHIIIQKDSSWGIYSFDQFYPALDGNSIILDFPYTAILRPATNRLILEHGDSSALVDEYLEVIVPMADQYIELVEDGYFLEANDSILDSRLSNTWYQDIHFNSNWSIGLKKSGVDIYYNRKLLDSADKAELVGKSALISHKSDSIYCHFTDSTSLFMYEGETIRPIRKMGQNSTVRHYIYTDKNNEQSVIDLGGRTIQLPKFDKLTDLGDNYMIFNIKGFVYNILDNDGNVVLKNVDAASAIGNRNISYLSDGKFGLFNAYTNSFIMAKYDKPLRMYSDEYFIVEVEGNFGLVDEKDSVIVPARYSDIRQYNDSIVVLNNNFRWIFWDLKNNSVLLDNVSDYWEYELPLGSYLKVFKGIGYGIWSPKNGLILSPTFGEIKINVHEDNLVFIAEKWVEEADLVILLYYDAKGKLLRKSVLTTDQYQTLNCDLN